VVLPSAGGVTGFGLKLAFAPDGSPDAVRLTGLLNPAIEETVTVAVAEPPGATEPELGLTFKENPRT
jgi:hypothetical protein